jgi:hypothetical protein
VVDAGGLTCRSAKARRALRRHRRTIDAMSGRVRLTGLFRCTLCGARWQQWSDTTLSAMTSFCTFCDTAPADALRRIPDLS